MLFLTSAFHYGFTVQLATRMEDSIPQIKKSIHIVCYIDTVSNGLTTFVEKMKSSK
jgi:hypothetical protein